MKEKIKHTSTGEVVQKVYIVIAKTPEKADKLLYEKINEDGELIFNRGSHNYSTGCFYYISSSCHHSICQLFIV